MIARFMFFYKPGVTRHARVLARTRPEPANTRLLDQTRTLNHLLENSSTTQNAGNKELTGDPTSLLDGGLNGNGNGAAAAVVGVSQGLEPSLNSDMNSSSLFLSPSQTARAISEADSKSLLVESVSGTDGHYNSKG